MKVKQTLAFLLALLTALTAFSGCAAAKPAGAEPEAVPTEAAEAAAETTAEPADSTITLTDMAGREITLESPATRVVALTAADCEILYAIGAGATLVGRGEYCDYPAEVSAVPAVQSGMETNLEQIIALEPQVLIMSTMAQTEEQVASLEAAGIKVVVSDAQNIEGVYTAISLIGALTGKSSEAQGVIDGMKETFTALAARAAELEGKSVYFEVSPLQYGLWTAGASTFMDEISSMLGLKNIFADLSGWAEVSEEQVLKLNPDIIVTVAMYFGEGPKPVDEILSRTGWQDVTAVKNGDILNLANNELSRPGPRLAEGAQALFDFVLASIAQDNAA
ncbi:MAG TPA: ABC transporter substrate-binding protein [Feifaniaceae bacterium]|nr:ABC transporter substrate-binding protein [Feifaniaceae bacterium]